MHPRVDEMPEEEAIEPQPEGEDHEGNEVLPLVEGGFGEPALVGAAGGDGEGSEQRQPGHHGGGHQPAQPGQQGGGPGLGDHRSEERAGGREVGQGVEGEHEQQRPGEGQHGPG
ncbi:MAG: hypothetical protein ACK56F_28320, partial [bacterium]